MAETEKVTIFISRAGEAKQFARVIEQILRDADYGKVLQDHDFGSIAFLDRMHEAFKSGGLVVGLLSPEWQGNAHCRVEWQAAIAGDLRPRPETSGGR